MGLDIKTLPKIEFLDKPQTTSFGSYNNKTQSIQLVTADRNPVDVLRTFVHELRHHQQRQEGKLQQGSGETGSEAENDANSAAGIVLRNFAAEFTDVWE